MAVPNVQTIEKDAHTTPAWLIHMRKCMLYFRVAHDFPVVINVQGVKLTNPPIIGMYNNHDP